MTVLEQHMYRDPLEVLIKEESRSCRGCIHEKQFIAFGNPVMVCTDKDERQKRRNHGKRCINYGIKGSK